MDSLFVFYCNFGSQFRAWLARRHLLFFPLAWLARMASRPSRDGAHQSGEAHMGPIPLGPQGGTLTARDRDDIWHAFRVSAAVRWRQQWDQRCLTLNGPAEYLQRARDMALERIHASGQEGGRAQDPTTTALSNDIADLKGRTEFLKTGMDNLMAEVQKASTMAAHAQYYMRSKPWLHPKRCKGL